eukprot:GILK01000283.1.p1 GENE.GILK01000283.1~~GILK01000283.1.p1  ORF type:complete len:478 (-),score=80.63 GILK01000283.1:85-1518(-)
MHQHKVPFLILLVALLECALWVTAGMEPGTAPYLQDSTNNVKRKEFTEAQAAAAVAPKTDTLIKEIVTEEVRNLKVKNDASHSAEQVTLTADTQNFDPLTFFGFGEKKEGEPNRKAIAIMAAAALLGAMLLSRAFKKKTTARTRSTPTIGEVLSDINAQKEVDEYAEMFEGDQEKQHATRRSKYTTLVNNYYDLVTDFYEYGWGRSFHFAPRYQVETFDESIRRHEFHLAAKIGAKEGMKVLDVGCGVGGPLRNIVRFSRANVTGINNNDYQLKRCEQWTEVEGLQKYCKYVKGDFMKMPFEDNTFDAIYAIEATCHAPDWAKCYGEVRRVLKKGGLFGVYEWCLTDKYDPNNKEHRDLKQAIELGDGLPDIQYTHQTTANLKKAGFEILESSDMALTCDSSWYAVLSPSYTLAGFKSTPLGRKCTHAMVTVMEALRLAPKGTTKTHGILITAAAALVRGGELGIFTPSFFSLCRKN